MADFYLRDGRLAGVVAGFPPYIPLSILPFIVPVSGSMQTRDEDVLQRALTAGTGAQLEKWPAPSYP
jgi:hypothetical protein